MPRSTPVASRPTRRKNGRTPAELPVSSAVDAGDSEVAAALINAAVIEMARQGYAATSVRSIASLAGVSISALYHNFGSKHDLLAEIMTRGNAHLYERARSVMDAAEPDPIHRFLALVDLFVERHLGAQRESFLGTTELRSLEPRARRKIVHMRDKTQQLFDAVVADGVAAGVFTTPYPREAARAVVTMCTSVAGWYREAGELSKEDIIVRYRRICLDTVGCVDRRNEDPEKATAGSRSAQ